MMKINKKYKLKKKLNIYLKYMFIIFDKIYNILFKLFI